MTDPNDAEKLTAIEAEWKARQAVEQAHATFHVKPSESAAQRLSDAIAAWRATSAPQFDRVDISRHVGELNRIARELATVTLAWAEMPEDSGVVVEWGYGVTYFEKHEQVETFVARALSREEAVQRAAAPGRAFQMGNGPLAGRRIWQSHGPVYRRVITTSEWVAVDGSNQ